MMNSSTVNQYQDSTSIKTYDQHNNSFSEEQVFDAIAEEIEIRRKCQREQNQQARLFRRNELEKTAENNDDNEDSPTNSNISRELIKTKSLNTNFLLLQKFLNGDIDIRFIEQHDLKRLLSEFELKYKSLMITNSSIYNENQALNYQITSYKDILDEHYEILNKTKRQYKEKCKEFDLQKQILIDCQKNNNQLKEILINCQKLIEESEKDFNINEPIDKILEKIFNDKSEQYQQIIELKRELYEEKNRFKIFKEQIPDSIDLHNQYINNIYDFEQQKQLIRQITDLKNRLQQIEADNGSLQQENKRYEAQLTRYKQELDDAQSVEDKLKQERRRLQGELRTARDELGNERMRSDILQRENERFRILIRKNLLNNTDDNLAISRSHSPLLSTNSNDIQSRSPLDDST